MAHAFMTCREMPDFPTEAGMARQTVGTGNPQTISAHKVA